MIIVYTLASVLVVSAVSLIGIGALMLQKNALQRALFILIAVAAGALFGDALIHLIPEAFESGLPTAHISLAVLAGIIAFFILEKFLRWKHTHELDNHLYSDAPHEEQMHPVGHLVIASDALHNLIDGVVIGVAYLVSVPTGIATTIAVILHEIPQEISDFGLLLHAGFSRSRALALNFLSALAAFLGAGAAMFFGDTLERAIPLLAAFAAGNFLYIAGTDLVPEIHKTSSPKHSIVQLISLCAGVAIMFALLVVE